MDWIREPRKPIRTMPNCIVMMSFPGSGKSAITADLTNNFAKGRSQVLSLGSERGYENLEVNEMSLTGFKEFEEYIDAMIKDQPYDFAIIDNLSVLDYWAEMRGTLQYMASAQGKSFNFKGTTKGPGLSAKTISQYYMPGDKGFQSVHTLADGAGL